MGGKVSWEAKTRYSKKAYDRVNFYVKKGEKEKIKAFAASQGKSLNGFIVGLIMREMEQNAPETKTAPKCDTEEAGTL